MVLCRPVVHRGCIHLRHAPRSGKGRSLTTTTAAQSEAATVQTNSATSTDDSAVPVVSENASAEVPHSEVATQEHLEAAHQKSQAGQTEPIAASAGSERRQASQGQAPPSGRSGLPGRSAGRAARRPRTVRKEQLVQGAEFEGTVVSHQQPAQSASIKNANSSACNMFCSHRSLPWHDAATWPPQDQLDSIEGMHCRGQSYRAAVVAGVCPGIRCLRGHWVSHRWTGACVTDDGQSPPKL